MKRYSYIILSITAILIMALIIWGVTSLVEPSLTNISDKMSIITVVAAIIGVIGFLAGFKDILEFSRDVKLTVSDKSKNIETAEGIRVSPIIQQSKENILLEYRIEVLEGLVEWLLKNGEYSQQIDSSVIDEIHRKALFTARRKYPEAEINIEGRG